MIQSRHTLAVAHNSGPAASGSGVRQTRVVRRHRRAGGIVVVAGETGVREHHLRGSRTVGVRECRRRQRTVGADG